MQNDVVKIRRAVKLLHQESIAVEPAWKGATKKVTLVTQDVYRIANPGSRKVHPNLDDDCLMHLRFSLQLCYTHAEILSSHINGNSGW